MKRNKVYLLGTLNQHERDLFKKDLISHSIDMASQIKNLKLDKDIVDIVVKNSVDIVMHKYRFDSGNNLGELVKTQVIDDLRAEYQKRYPNKVGRVKWPDSKKTYASRKLYRMIQQLKSIAKEKQEDIFLEVNKLLNDNQQKILSSIYVSEKFIRYQVLSDQLSIDCTTISNEIILVHSKLNQVLINLGVTL